MAKPESEPKTELGARLRQVRRWLGDPDREEFASALGISKNTLAYYERGERTPDASTLAAYHHLFRIDVTWLVTGNGAPSTETDSPPSPNVLQVNSSMFHAVKKMVRNLHNDAGIRLPDEASDEEAIRWYNELISMARGNLEEGKLRSMLPALEYEIQQAVSKAVAEPGTGKRLA